MNRVLFAALFIFLATGTAHRSHAQSPSVPPASIGGAGSSMPDPRPGRRDADGIGPAPGMQEKLEKGRQSERQKRMVADTDRLLTLAAELKADIDKTTKDQLSIEVIKKAEEIEKLAKSVKERMRG